MSRYFQTSQSVNTRALNSIIDAERGFIHAGKPDWKFAEYNFGGEKKLNYEI